MKKFIALALVTLGVSVSARAQWIVCDPANTVQSVINTAQEIAKFVQMINNQVQQIQTLADQHRYGQVFLFVSDRTPQAHLFHPRDQRCWPNSQEFRRAISTFDSPVRFLKDDQQVFAFAPLQFGFGEEFRFGVARRSRRWPGGSERGFDHRQIEVQHAAP